MDIKRRLLFAAVAAMAGLGGPAGQAHAAFPEKPIRVIVPYVGGGSTDLLARLLGDKMGEKLGQPVVVHNQPGGGGAIGTAAVARAEPDGYTLVMATNGTHSINPSLYASLPYDAVKDFAPVSLVAAVPLVLVVPAQSPVRQMSELQAYGQSRPGRSLNYGSAGVGSSGHLASEMLKSTLGFEGAHVPYKGDGQALVDLIAGRLDFSFANMPATMSHVRAGTLRPLAVSTGQRSGMLPDVPTVAQVGFPMLEVNPWYGFLAPAGTPPGVIRTLNEAVAAALADPAVRERMEQVGAQPLGTSPEDFARIIAEDTAKFAKVIEASGAKAE